MLQNSRNVLWVCESYNYCVFDSVNLNSVINRFNFRSEKKSNLGEIFIDCIRIGLQLFSTLSLSLSLCRFLNLSVAYFFLGLRFWPSASKFRLVPYSTKKRQLVNDEICIVNNSKIFLKESFMSRLIRSSYDYCTIWSIGLNCFEKLVYQYKILNVKIQFSALQDTSCSRRKMLFWHIVGKS